MGNNITDWVIQKWVFPLPGAYQSFPDLYLSLITFLILLAATLVELCQNLFPSVSWFSLNAWDFHLPSPPVPVPGSWELHFKAVPPTCCNPLGCDGGSSGSANCVSMGCSDRMKVCAGPLMSLTKVLAPPGWPDSLPLLKVLSSTQHSQNPCSKNTSIYWWRVFVICTDINGPL